jgi:multiple sugar transport system substrate-binding protein
MKTLAKLITLVLAVTLLAACGTPATPTSVPTAVPPTAVPPTAVPPTPIPPTATPAPVTLRYANWNLGTEADNNVERQMIKAYTDAHPWVTIEIVDMADPNGVGWDGLLTAYAAKGELPDVFMANNVPLYVQNGWLADVSSLVASDADWASIPQPLKDAFTYNGKVMGIPAGQFLMGYFVNQDLYTAANLDAPTYGISPEDFFNLAKQMNNPAKGIVGLDEAPLIEGWYAHAVDPNLRFFSFDGKHMNYNSQAFKDGIAKSAEMIPYSWQGLSDADKKNFKATGPWELFLNQEVGVRYDATWSLSNYVQNAKFNWDFIGLPGGSQLIVFDAFAVSKTSPNLEAAYDFAKWMTFSSDGYVKRADIAKVTNAGLNLPIAMTSDNVTLFKTFIDKPGINKALDNLNNSILESLAKVVPGYIDARWQGKPGIDIGTNKDVTIGWIMDNAPMGSFKFEDYSAQLETFANKILDDATAAMNK